MNGGGDDLRALAEQAPEARAARAAAGGMGAPVLTVIDHGIHDGCRQWTVRLLVDGRPKDYRVVGPGSESAAIGRAREIASPRRARSW